METPKPDWYLKWIKQFAITQTFRVGHVTFCTIKLILLLFWRNFTHNLRAWIHRILWTEYDWLTFFDRWKFLAEIERDRCFQKRQCQFRALHMCKQRFWISISRCVVLMQFLFYAFTFFMKVKMDKIIDLAWIQWLTFAQ